MIVPWRRAAANASSATAAVVSDSAQKMPPQWSQRAPCRPKISSQSIVPGRSWDTAVCPRSEHPTAPRTPNPRSVKLSPLRTSRPTPSDGTHADVRPVDPSLTDQVLDEPPDRVVDERRDDRSLEAEAPVQAARDVVLAAALPRRELPGRRDAHVARIEPEHHLAERDEVVPALGAGAQRERAHRDSSTSRRASRASYADRVELAGRDHRGLDHPAPAAGEYLRHREVAGQRRRRDRPRRHERDVAIGPAEGAHVRRRRRAARRGTA